MAYLMNIQKKKKKLNTKWFKSREVVNNNIYFVMSLQLHL